MVTSKHFTNSVITLYIYLRLNASSSLCHSFNLNSNTERSGGVFSYLRGGLEDSTNITSGSDLIASSITWSLRKLLSSYVGGIKGSVGEWADGESDLALVLVSKGNSEEVCEAQESLRPESPREEVASD
jgi:hypothetical protein